ncbi:MAG: cation:proton antiporter [Rhodanobacteraceae bacterium]|nr:cation:proton antiporter [Rhodanobacteraceae bacterium]
MEHALKADPYVVFLLGLGVLILLVSWAPVGLRRMPLSLAILCVALGWAAFGSGLLAFEPDPRTYDTVTERLVELVVIVSLMGAGLKLDRPLSWRGWSSTWRLLAIAMPLTMLATAWLGVAGLGFSLPMAMLLAASIAPTDPVLASDVQVGPPRTGNEDEVRFGLTSEAGLNDALAFPFVHLAIVAAAGGLSSVNDMGAWFAVDVLWKLLAGAGMGYLIGRGLGFLIFHNAKFGLSRVGDGLVSLAATFLAYSLTELMHGYGFLAVFICALTIRAWERDHYFHDELHHFSDLVERLLMMLVLVLFGGALAHGMLDALTVTDIIVGLVILLVVRPVAGMIAMIGSPHPLRERALLAFLGIRGLGTVYYVAYGLNHGDFGVSERLWAIVGFIIAASILIHGVSASPLLIRLAQRRRAAGKAAA